MPKVKKKQPRRKKGGIMGASQIPYAQRLQMEQKERIAVTRHNSAKVSMFCLSLAIHRVKGVGYKGLVKFSLRYKEVEDEIYEDLEHGMDKARRRMEQIGFPISGDLYSVQMPGMTVREQQVHDHGMQAAQISLIAGAISMNDVFGYGKIVQERISEENTRVSKEYNEKGFGWLMEEMKKLGFLVVDGEVRAFLDDDDKPITPKQAKKEGYKDA